MSAEVLVWLLKEQMESNVSMRSFDTMKLMRLLDLVRGILEARLISTIGVKGSLLG